MISAPIWLTEADVVASLDLESAVATLTHVLSAEAGGLASNMVKTHVMVGANDVLQAIGGSVAAEGYCGTKTWVNIAGKSQTVLILFSLVDGSVGAVIEATALGQIRTAAMSGVGTDWLAPADATTLAIIGTGKQALPQIAAVIAVRPIKTVRIFARTEANRIGLATVVRAKFPHINAIAAPNLLEAVDGAQIVTLCTNAMEPFLSSDMVTAGTHINAVGAIVPARSEFSGDVFPRCDAISVDTVAGAKELSREFIDYFGSGKESWDRVVPISALIRAGRRRPTQADLTLFKPLGMGMADVAIGIEVLKRCVAQGRGTTLPERRRMDVPLNAAKAAE